MSPSQIDLLSPREREVLLLVGQGLRSKEIARQLDISPRTVDTHIGHAVAALGARSRLDAVRMITDQIPYVEIPTQPAHLVGEQSSVERSDADRSYADWRRLPILRNGRLNNDLTTWQRLGWILAGAVAIIILFAQLAAGLRVTQEIALGLHS